MKAPDFPSPENSTLHLLNCIRVLTRVMPFIFESENMEEWENEFFWTSQTRKSKKIRKPDNSTEQQKDNENQNISNTNENNVLF